MTHTSTNNNTAVSQPPGLSGLYIYQMGKVGSISLLKTIQTLGMGVYHEHNLTLEHSDAVGIKRDMGRLHGLGLYFQTLKRKLYPGSRLKEFNSWDKIKIISLVREPISRNMSLCFQHAGEFIRDDVTRHCFNDDHSAYRLFAEYLDTRIDHRAGIEWFDREFFPTTGVNIYDHGFDTEKGYSVIEDGRYHILIMQLEKLDHMADVIRTFLNLGAPFEMVKSNVGSQKWYTLLYRDFKARYTPSPDLVDDLYQSKYMTHFYSPSDIAVFKKKWTGKRASGGER